MGLFQVVRGLLHFDQSEDIGKISVVHSNQFEISLACKIDCINADLDSRLDLQNLDVWRSTSGHFFACIA